MTYQVLARKWRPQNFTDMVGQNHISATLCNAIKNQRIGHAYLFVGTRGTGKTTTARIFAKAINCENPLPDANPCNKCTNCVEITSGSSMDVLEIDGASNNGVDDIRKIRDNVLYTPARCKYKVYIIDEVHMLTTAAWNALLKTLEEPPAHVKFLFATTEANKVLPTILSRCQRFDLKRISQGTIARKIHEIAVAENAPFDQAALNSIARAANGGMRDALSIMDQMIAFCSNQELITENDVSEVFGLTSSLDLAKIISAMLTDNTAQLINEINRLSNMGRNLEQLYSDLLHFCRNLMICTISGNDAGQILDLDEYDLEIAKSIAKQSSADTIQRVMDGFLNYDNKLRHTLNKRVFMEMTLVRIMKDAHTVSLNDILARLNQLRQSGSLDSLNTQLAQSPKLIELPDSQKKNEITIPIVKKKPTEIVELPQVPLQYINIEKVTEKKETPLSPQISENSVAPKPKNEPPPQLKQQVIYKEIDDSYSLDYSTLLDSEYIKTARKQDPLQLNLKKFQSDFDENNETPSSHFGLTLKVVEEKSSEKMIEEIVVAEIPSSYEALPESLNEEEVFDIQEEVISAYFEPVPSDNKADQLLVEEENPAKLLWNKLPAEFQQKLDYFTPVNLLNSHLFLSCPPTRKPLVGKDKILLEEELSKINGNKKIEIFFIGSSASKIEEPTSKTSGEEVWQRVENNSFVQRICKEFDGKIIDVRG